jgi:TRAP-type mannitol/chloroaromatic compound transport system permease small subunit
MALRGSLGTVGAVATLMAAFWLVVLPSDSPQIFVTLAVLLVGLVTAAVLRANAGTFAAACLMGWFSVMIATPFALSDREINALRRIANRGDERAEALLAYYETMTPFAPYLMVVITVLVLLVFVYGMTRGRHSLFQNMLNASNGLADFLARVGIVSAIVLLSALIFAIMYDVIQRQYLGFNPQWTRTEWYRMFSATRVQEMEWHLHAALFLMCLGFAYVRDAHVRIELVRDTLSPRTRVWIELAGCLLFMVPYCYVVLQYGIENALRSYAIGERSAAQTGLDHRFVIKAMLPLGFALIALAGMSVALKCVVYLFGPPALKSQASYYAHSHQNPAPPAEPDPVADPAAARPQG